MVLSGGLVRCSIDLVLYRVGCWCGLPPYNSIAVVQGDVVWCGVACVVGCGAV